MGNLVTGKQVAAGRALADITQRELAKAAGLHVNSVRYVERPKRITTDNSNKLIEDALLRFGVVSFREPTIGVRRAK